MNQAQIAITVLSISCILSICAILVYCLVRNKGVK